MNLVFQGLLKAWSLITKKFIANYTIFINNVFSALNGYLVLCKKMFISTYRSLIEAYDYDQRSCN